MPATATARGTDPGTPRSLPNSAPCPCGHSSGKAPARVYGDCCGPYHAGQGAADALALMRSRYSAFVLCNAAYLRATWYPSQRPARVDFEAGLRWLGLEVRSHTVDDATHAQVEFVARCKPAQGPAQRLHERSRFVCEGGHWYYLDGDAL